ncbi:MAG: hypothetical protein IJF07_00515 [Lachnospiraceae bacterium]|nr:hypothetical protein [Lachnospiraceae bacterium]
MNTPRLLSKRKGYLYFWVIGFLFVFFWKTEKNLAEQGNILWTAKYTKTTLGLSLLVGLILGSICAYVMYRLAKRKGTRCSFAKQDLALDSEETMPKIKADAQSVTITSIQARIEALTQGRVFWFSLLLISLSWLPAYLAYYPGICSYDTSIQTGQIVQNIYIDHHPIMHTLMLEWAMELGSMVFGEVNTGIGLYTLGQMLFLAASMSYGMKVLHQFGVKVWLQIVVLLSNMLYPFHWYMSISTTKDTIFSSFLVLFLVALVALLLEDKNQFCIGKREFLLVVSAIGVILFRNNGKYAMMVLLTFLLVMVIGGKGRRKLFGKLLICVTVAFIVGNLLLSFLFSVTNAEQGDRREMLSMPIQQLARCMIYHGGVGVLPEDDNTMSQVDKALINDFILNEGYKDYNPHLSDMVKTHTNTYVVRYRTKEFVQSYLRLFTSYPGDFVNAALAVNAGFLYPDDISHANVNKRNNAQNMGYVQTRWVDHELNPRGIYKASKWEGLREKMEQWAENNEYLKLPVIKYIFVPGSYLWFYLLLLGYFLINRKYRMCLPIAFVGGYYFTMFLGPTVQLRYLYPLMIVLPYLVLLAREKYLCEDIKND